GRDECRAPVARAAARAARARPCRRADGRAVAARLPEAAGRAAACGSEPRPPLEQPRELGPRVEHPHVAAGEVELPVPAAEQLCRPAALQRRDERVARAGDDLDRYVELTELAHVGAEVEPPHRLREAVRGARCAQRVAKIVGDLTQLIATEYDLPDELRQARRNRLSERQAGGAGQGGPGGPGPPGHRRAQRAGDAP